MCKELNNGKEERKKRKATHLAQRYRYEEAIHPRRKLKKQKNMK